MTPYLEIAAERRAQDRRWGGPAHDDTHTMHDWLNLLTHQFDLAEMDADSAKRHADVRDPEIQQVNALLFRQRMVKLAAVAVAAMEWAARQGVEDA